MLPEPVSEGWDGLRDEQPPVDREDELARAFATCFRGASGRIVLEHLRRAFLDRRVPPTASDAELRHVEGQRWVAAHILALIERGRE
jgi:hypothetical protein